jgi:hypothetical protein
VTLTIVGVDGAWRTVTVRGARVGRGG